jgi:hypothetical protein
MPQYEIHLTVDPADIDEAVKVLEHDIFSVKGLQFQNWTRKGVVLDAMTSTRLTAPSGMAARISADVQAETLRMDGINVLRVKVETDPFHTEQLESICASAYYETHLPIMGGEGFTLHGGLHSRNLLKRNEWITIRSDLSFQNHFDRCSRFVGEIVFQGFCLTGKPHHEWVLFDSNREHDKDWE